MPKEINLYKVKKRELFSYVVLFFAKPLVNLAIRLKITGNQISFASFIVAVASFLFLVIGRNQFYFIIAAVFAFLHLLLDKCDGNVARLTGVQSKYGAWVDSAAGFASNAIILMGISFALMDRISLILGTIAVSSYLYSQLMMFVLRCEIGKLKGKTSGFEKGFIRYAYGMSLLPPIMLITALFNKIHLTLIFFAVLGVLYAFALIIFQNRFARRFKK